MMEKQPPKQIYLQAYDSDSYDDNTWCSDKQNEDDIEYILQSEYDQLKSENERLQKYKEKLISDATQNEFVLLAYHDSLKEMKARVQELEQERRWIPVSERLPEDTRIYDVAIADYEYSWTGSCVFGKWIGESGKAILGVTHWKYRTQPPQEVE